VNPPHSWVPSTVSEVTLSARCIAHHFFYRKKRQLLTLINSGDEAQVSGAALLGLPEVGIRAGVGVDDAAVGKNNLPVDDIVACKAMRVAVEGILKSC
jgi:hypothetical protein